MVRMFKTAKLGAVALALSGLFALAPAHAQNATQCGVSGSAVAPSSIVYDPFSPSGLSSVTIPLVLTRATGSGGKKTQTVAFVLTKPVGSPAFQVVITLPGATAVDALYTEGMIPGTRPVISNVEPGQIFYNFGGANLPDTVTANVTVTVPPNTDLSAGEPIRFDLVYVCNGTGNLPDVLSPTVNPNAISINVNVLSALQASYVGTALDFGEVGDKTNTDVTGAPAAFTRSGDIRVASSGPYNVTMTSTNNYRLTFPGGNPATPMQSLTYSATLLGNTRTGTSGSTAAVPAITKTCARAGVGGLLLPVTATLTEGGASKTPAPLYSDTLNITIAPQVATVIGQPCF